MMWRLKLLALKHRTLCWLSSSYRAHDTLLADRNRWRSDCVAKGNEVNAANNQIRSLVKELDAMTSRAQLAEESAHHATEQLLAERKLRERAEEKADQYHAELVESLKDHTNWLARGRFGQPVHGGAFQPTSAAASDEPVKPHVSIPTKRMAREVAREVEDNTMNDLLTRLQQDINRHDLNSYSDAHIGPEMTTPV